MYYTSVLKSIQAFTVLVVLGTGSAVCALEAPSQLFTIQLGAFASKSEADGVVAKLASEGWAPCKVVQVDPSVATRFKVYFGQFETYADADWWKRALRRRGYAEAFNVALPNPKKEGALEPAGPLVPNFRPVKTFGTKTDVVKTAIQQLPAVLQAHACILLSEHPEQIGADTTQTKTIVAVFQAIADGHAGAERQEVCRARVAIANAFHYASLRWLTAYHAYGEALKIAPVGTDLEAECLLQRAALTMELANSAKGSMNEVRRACTLVKEKVSEQNTRCHAVAHLMYAESLFNEGRFDESLTSFTQIAVKWPQRRREVAAAQVYMGIALARLNQPAEAALVLEQAVSLDVTPQEFFQWRGAKQSPAADAASWLIHCYRELKEPEKADAWKVKLDEFKAQLGERRLVTSDPQ